MRLVLIAVSLIIAVECATLFVLFVPVVHDSWFIPCLSPCKYGAGFEANYTSSISFHYLNVGGVYGVCGGYQVLDARNGIDFCLANTIAPVSSPEGLILNVNMSPGTLHTGETLGISISLFNSLSTRLNLATASYNSSSWKVSGLPVAVWGGCNGMEPIEFMIVKGNFSEGELQVASVNSSYPAIFCMEGGSVNDISFLPRSSNVTTTGYVCIETCFPNHESWNLSTSFSVDGYWAYPLNNSEANDIYTPYPPGCSIQPCGVTYAYPEVGPIAQHTFTPGWYTLMVADEWGQTVLLHFSVG